MKIHRFFKPADLELDQWDLLRQRRGLRDAVQDPDVAQVRPDIVEKYEQ